MTSGAPLPVSRVGVVGAGTMGSGICQALALAGASVRLVEPDAAARKRAIENVTDDLEQAVRRGRLAGEAAEAARCRIQPTDDLDALQDSEAVIEAIPEQLDLKRSLFAKLGTICEPSALLATNTSSLLVSAIAAGAPEPERIIGLHFFNPPQRMRLVEVVPGLETSPRALSLGVALVKAMGKLPIVAADGIGFVVNRCARPFYGEALRLVQEGTATVEQVDRCCRTGGGFRLGPFELIDLIGVDVNLDIARSFYEQSFGEPRWRPSPLQAKLVAAGRHGRKASVGFYDYRDGRHRPDDPAPPPVGGGDDRTVLIRGTGALADAIRVRAAQAQFAVSSSEPWLEVDCSLDGPARACSPRVVLCAGRGLSSPNLRGAAGFYVLPPADTATLVELASNQATDRDAASRAQEFFSRLGYHVEHVAGAPGMVLGRIVCQLINEAAFAVGEGVASEHDVDAATTAGLNHPLGPFAWRDRIGHDHVRAVLTGLYRERQDDRYRLAPMLLDP